MQALLAGASPDRLSPAAMLALSHTMGNSALLDLISRTGQGADLTSPPPSPGPLPDMAPAVLGEGAPDLIDPVDFAGLPSLEAGAGPAYGGAL